MGCKHHWVVRELEPERIDRAGMQWYVKKKITVCSECGIRDPDEAQKEHGDYEDDRREQRYWDRQNRKWT